MQQVELTLTVGASAQGTALSIRLDKQMIWQGDPGDNPGKISYNFDDKDGVEHILTLELSGKTRNHTRIDSDNNIVEDLLVSVNDFIFDGINVNQQVWELAEYRHDFNGTKTPTTEKFYGFMGCNGTVTMRFSSPVYLWLLENL